MVDALALGASGATHEGSSPFSPTKVNTQNYRRTSFGDFYLIGSMTNIPYNKGIYGTINTTL